MTDPEPPRPPGVPDLDLDLPFETGDEDRKAPDDDAEPGAPVVEPPD